MATGSLVAFALYRYVHSRYRPEADAPLFAPSLSGLAPSLALVAQRHKTMLQENNLWESARELARHWFAQAAPQAVLQVLESVF